jgi:hypothetical protein
VLPLWLLLALGCATAGDGEPIAKGDGDDFDPPDAGTSPDAPPPPSGAVTLSQSSSMAIEQPNSFGCVVLDPFFGFPVHHRATSYYRVFDLASEGIDSEFRIESVTVGIEIAEAGDSGSQPLEVKFHTVAGSLLTTNMTFLGSGQITVTNQTGSMVEIPTQVTAPGGSQLVVEVHVPDGAPDRLLAPGSNKAGQLAPTYYRSEPCGTNEPVDASEVTDSEGNPLGDMHLVLTVAGSY